MTSPKTTAFERISREFYGLIALKFEFHKIMTKESKITSELLALAKIFFDDFVTHIITESSVFKK